MNVARCAQCGARFGFTPAKDGTPPAICGALYCRARENWTDEQWAGAARMARVRRRVGIELSALDIAALNRAERSVA